MNQISNGTEAPNRPTGTESHHCFIASPANMLTVMRTANDANKTLNETIGELFVF